MKKILDTICTQECMVHNDQYIDLEKMTGRPLNNIPLSIRERDEALIDVSSFSAIVDDEACLPLSGGIGGLENIAFHYGVGAQQFRKHILSNCPYIKWIGNIPVTHVSSASHDGANYQLEREQHWQKNLGIES